MELSFQNMQNMIKGAQEIAKNGISEPE